ncbi:MAG: S24 family peptidase [Sideroxydans sp.]|nr:S24 family peptidase [Sideroxydans sp.]
MGQIALHSGRRHSAALLSLTHPNKDWFQRQRAQLHKATPVGVSANAEVVEHFVSHWDDESIEHRESTFFMRLAGDSMRDLGIYDGDLLAVDRALPAMHGSVVIAVVDGEFTVKQLLFTPSGKVLRAGNENHADVLIRAGQDFAIWGVVQWNVHKAAEAKLPQIN